MKINQERIAKEFTTLCEIESPSGNEGKIAEYLKKVFQDLGALLIKEDDSAVQTGSDCGNLFVRFAGEFGYVGIFKKHKNTPFARMDTLVYSPLCLFLSVCCAGRLLSDFSFFAVQ